jgi:hypothetical protein
MITGANIFCVACGARPYPELGPPGAREDFDLMRLARDGRPAESTASGEWFCSQHFERVGASYRIAAEWIPQEPAPSEAAS